MTSFKDKLKKEFAGKRCVSFWDNEIAIDKDGDPVVHVGLNEMFRPMDADYLPAEVDGIKITYIYTGDIKLMQNQRTRFDPLIGGISIGALDVTAGTLGGIVFDKDSGRAYILTSEHVVSNTRNIDPTHPKADSIIIQPGSYDGGKMEDNCGFLHRVGGMKKAVLSGNPCDIDAALVSPTREYDGNELNGIGTIDNLEHVQGENGDLVVKSGRTTGVTESLISSTDISANIPNIWGGTAYMEKLISVSPAFLEGGDSGSIVYKYGSMEPVGLAFAGSSVISLVIPAETIVKKFNIRFGDKKPEEDDKEGGDNVSPNDVLDKPIWKMKEFWVPIVTGIATAISVALEVGTGVLIEPATIISLGLFLLSIFLGVEWANGTKIYMKLKGK